MLKSPKYKRSLKSYEEKRFQELVIQYEKVTGKKYKNQQVEEGWTLIDIACSKGRYEKYYNGYRKALQKRYEENEKRKDEMKGNGLSPDLVFFDEVLNENLDKRDNQENKEDEEKLNNLINEIIGDFNEFIKENNELINQKQTLSSKHYKICQNACQLMIERNEKYGDSYKVLSIQSLANLCEMKLNRIAKLGEIDAKTEDELIDTLNYMVFGLIKLKEGKNLKN